MKLNLLFIFLVLRFSVSAGDFRGGDIHIEQYTALSVQANINVNLIIHSEIDQITICWGDGSCDILGSPQILENPAFDTKTLRFIWIHQYNQPGFYDISVEECCWANDIFNMNLINEQAIFLEASFKLTSPFNVMPYSSSLPISTGFFGEYHVYNSFVTIPDNDESTFEICEVDVNNYFLLEDIFPQSNNFFFDELTGGFTWFSPPAVGFFIVKICITTSRGGQIISETSRDILIAIDTPVSVEEHNNGEGLNLKCFPNPAKDFIRFDYFLNKESNVEISLFDVTGKEIKTLFSGIRNSGKQEEIADIRNLQAGFYFCKTKSGDNFSVISFIKN